MSKAEEVSTTYIAEPNEEVPAGFKKTEVGVIPEDWNIISFGEVLKIRHGQNQKSVDSENGTYPILATGGQIGWATTYLLDKPSVLIGRKGTINKPRYIEVPFWTVDTLFYSEINPAADTRFIYYKFCMIDWMQYNEASGVPSLNASTIESVLAALPSKKEQTAIANTLSDVDALITSLEKLIAKKRAIKTATMQQLLTGKKRLPPFDQQHTGYKQTELGEIPEDWEVAQLGHLCAYQNGTAQEQHFNGYDGFKVISIGNYSAEGKFISTGSFIDRSKARIVQKFILSKMDLAMILNDKTAVGTIIGRVLLIDKDNEFVMNQRTMRLVSRGKVSPEYLYYLINSDFVHKNIVEMAKPGTQIYINTDDVTGLPLGYPRDHEEQSAIVEILKNLDAEVELLDCRIKKTKLLKQGMMQELLTGRTRLL